jgi:hypothetical protein
MDDKYRSQYREYPKYPERLMEAICHSKSMTRKYAKTVLGVT